MEEEASFRTGTDGHGGSPVGVVLSFSPRSSDSQLLPHSSWLKEFSRGPEIYFQVQARKYLNYLAIFIVNGSFLKIWWPAFGGHPPFPLRGH